MIDLLLVCAFLGTLSILVCGSALHMNRIQDEIEERTMQKGGH